MADSKTSVKSIVNDLINAISKLFTIRLPIDVIHTDLKNQYDKGLEEAEVEFNLNFTRNNESFETLETYVVDNIKDMDTQTRDKLRQIITRGVVENTPRTQLSKLISENFDVTKTRAKAIAQTETSRALNLGRLDGAKQSNLNLKKWVIVAEDERTSGICSAMHAKYGAESKAIPLDTNFTVTVDKKTVSVQAPPFHVNCRTRLMTVQE